MRIYLDLEATEAGEVLAIGAVTETDARFQMVVAPAFTPLTPRITALTGITEDTLKSAYPFTVVAAKFKEWVQKCVAWKDNTAHIVTFGKNDSKFLAETYDLYRSHGYDAERLEPMKWLINCTSNGADPIYQAFRRPLVSLRSAYLTYREQGELNGIHLPVEDACMFKELYEAVERGWTLPADAAIVKVAKPQLPPKAPKQNFNTPEDLQRTVVVYWRKGNQDRSAVYRDLVGAAKGTCTKAINSGLDPETVAYRVLNAAIAGESYCDRKFFLVD